MKILSGITLRIKEKEVKLTLQELHQLYTDIGKLIGEIKLTPEDMREKE